MSEYSVEEVRYIANKQRATMPYLAATLDAYADLREQIERAREGVTDAVLDRFDEVYEEAWERAAADDEVAGKPRGYSAERIACRTALLAVAHLLPSLPAATPNSAKGRIDFKGMWDAMSDQVTASQPAQAAQQPIIVPPYVSADDANRLYGERFGVDWKYEAITAAPTAEPVAQGDASPAGYHYVYRDTDGGEVIRKNGGQEVNGSKPLRAIPYWYAQPASPERPAGRQGEAAPFGYLSRDVTPFLSTIPHWHFTHHRVDPHGCIEAMPVYTHPAAPVGVPDAIVPSNELPGGYRLGHRDSDWWPLLGDHYISDKAYPSKAHAVLAAWQHSHEKLDRLMDSIRRLAIAAAPSAPQGEVCNRDCDCVGPCKMGIEG